MLIASRWRALAAVLGLAWIATAVPALGQTSQPLVPQPAAEALLPGLAVTYYANLFRHVSEIEEWKSYRDGKPGEPIAMLNYKVGQGEVLTSGQSDGMGAEITGLIHLEERGTYAFAAQSNDGVRVEIGGVVLLEDPDVHADRFSDIAQIEVAEPGWYPLRILYFERKNTATLELYWRPPSMAAGTMPLVPAAAFAHLKEE